MNKISYLIAYKIIIYAIMSLCACAMIEPQRSPYSETKLSRVMIMKNDNYAIIVRSNMDYMNSEKGAYNKATMQCNKEGKEMYFLNEYKIDYDTLYYIFKCVN